MEDTQQTQWTVLGFFAFCFGFTILYQGFTFFFFTLTDLLSTYYVLCVFCVWEYVFQYLYVSFVFSLALSICLFLCYSGVFLFILLLLLLLLPVCILMGVDSDGSGGRSSQGEIGGGAVIRIDCKKTIFNKKKKRPQVPGTHIYLIWL